MRPGLKRSFFTIFAAAALLFGCAGGGIQTACVRSGNPGVLPIRAGDFYFRPNTIRVDKPGPLAVAVENLSCFRQNFTLKDPGWKTLESVDLPPGGTATINVDFCMPGVYRFYCNRTLGTVVGMNGQIYVGE